MLDLSFNKIYLSVFVLKTLELNQFGILAANNFVVLVSNVLTETPMLLASRKPNEIYKLSYWLS